MRHPRYEVRSITGYSTAGVPGEGKLSTAWWVADSWYCFREQSLVVVAEGSVARSPRWRVSGKTTTRRSVAERNCERLNRENEEWLAGG